MKISEHPEAFGVQVENGSLGMLIGTFMLTLKGPPNPATGKTNIIPCWFLMSLKTESQVDYTAFSVAVHPLVAYLVSYRKPSSVGTRTFCVN